MPCTMDPWEIEFEERRVRKEKSEQSLAKYGIDLTDPKIKDEVMCQLARFIYQHRLEKDVPALAAAWIKAHKKQDKIKGKKPWRRMKASRSYCLLTKRSLQ